MRAGLIAFAALAVSLGACAQGPDDSGPVELVEALYDEPVLWFDSDAEWDAYFTQDLGRAIVADASQDEVGSVNFDYRYDSQDGTVSDLRFESLNRAPGLVAATLAVEGDPRTIVWTLCERADGTWRIADAARQDGDYPWSLRSLLNLSPAPPVC